MTDVKGSGEAVENIMLSVTSSSMTGLAVGQRWSGEAYPWRDAQNVQTTEHHFELLQQNYVTLIFSTLSFFTHYIVHMSIDIDPCSLSFLSSVMYVLSYLITVNLSLRANGLLPCSSYVSSGFPLG